MSGLVGLLLVGVGCTGNVAPTAPDSALAPPFDDPTPPPVAPFTGLAAPTGTGSRSAPGVLAGDRDQDGAIDEVDCAPDDPWTYPGARERCDGLDNNCDTLVEPACTADLGDVVLDIDTDYSDGLVDVLGDVDGDGRDDLLVTGPVGGRRAGRRSSSGHP